jgi:hypothetical protein
MEQWQAYQKKEMVALLQKRQKCKLGIYYEQRKGYLDHKMSALWVQAPTILTT